MALILASEEIARTVASIEDGAGAASFACRFGCLGLGGAVILMIYILGEGIG